MALSIYYTHHDIIDTVYICIHNNDTLYAGT